MEGAVEDRELGKFKTARQFHEQHMAVEQADHDLRDALAHVGQPDALGAADALGADMIDLSGFDQLLN